MNWRTIKESPDAPAQSPAQRQRQTPLFHLLTHLPRDRLPAYDHLAAWTDRNAGFGNQIGAALAEHGFISELVASKRVAQWAYSQTEVAGGLTWLRADEMVPLTANWRGLLEL